MSDELARRALEDPWNSAAVRVWADALSEAGDPRGPLLTLCRAREAERFATPTWATLEAALDELLWARGLELAALLPGHKLDWPTVEDFPFGFPSLAHGTTADVLDRLGQPEPVLDVRSTQAGAAPLFEHPRFRLVGRLTFEQPLLDAEVRALVALRLPHLSSLTFAATEPLLSAVFAGEFAHLERVEVRGDAGDERSWARWLSSAAADRVVELQFRDAPDTMVSDAALSQWCARRPRALGVFSSSRLEREALPLLRLAEGELSLKPAPGASGVLHQLREGTQLRHLMVPPLHRELEPSNLSLERLDTLQLANWQPTVDELDAALARGWLHHARTLTLPRRVLTDWFLARLERDERPWRVERLEVVGSGAVDESRLRATLDSPRFARLRELVAPGLLPLEFAASARHVRLGFVHVTSRAPKRLLRRLAGNAASVEVRGLRVSDATGVSDRELRALAESSHLAKLRSVWLRHASCSEETMDALRQRFGAGLRVERREV